MRRLNIQRGFRDQQLRLWIGLGIIGVTLISTQAFWLSVGKMVPPSSISVTYHFGAQELFVGSLLAVSACLFAYYGRQPRKEWMDVSWDYWFTKVACICTFIIAMFPTSMGVNWVKNHQLPAEHIRCLIDIGATQLRIPITEISAQSITTCNPSELSFIPIVHQVAAVILIFLLLFSTVRFATRAKQKLVFAQLYLKEKTEKLQRRYQMYVFSVCLMLSSVVIGLTLEFGADFHYGLMLLEVVSLLSLGFSWLVSSRLVPGTTEASDIELLLSLVE